MCNFELSIIAACREVFPAVQVKCCFFHLGQSVYRRVQAEGFQEAYNNAADRTLKTYTHMILALAYVPLNDVRRVFNLLREDCPEDLIPVVDYFERIYVIGVPRRGRRRAVPPRYVPELWNQHESAIELTHKTNNSAEGYHNPISTIIGRHHPDLYTALGEIQREQADCEVAVAELSLGRRVKVGPKRKWLDLHSRIQGIAGNYDRYKDENSELDYLRTLAHTTVL